MMTTEETKMPSQLDLTEIVKVLPHRYPFLLVDRITEVNLEEKYIVGKKNLTINEAFFQGHFPGNPIMPGVLIVEALAQTGGVYVHLQGYKKLAVLLNISNAKFRNPVYPGDTLTLRVEEKLLTNKGGKFQAFAYVGEKLATQAEVGFVFVDQESVKVKTDS